MILANSRLILNLIYRDKVHRQEQEILVNIQMNKEKSKKMLDDIMEVVDRYVKNEMMKEKETVKEIPVKKEVTGNRKTTSDHSVTVEPTLPSEDDHPSS